MSKLGKFLGHSEEVEVQGEKLMITPLKVKDLKLFVGKEKASQEEQMEMSKEIIKKSLVDEEVTDEEIDAMRTEAFMELMNAINKVNGFTNDKIEQLRPIK